MNYWGTREYLDTQQKQQALDWLAQKGTWTIEEIIEHLENTYDVVYQTQQSYHALLQQAGFSWQKSQPTHPDKGQAQVEEKKLKLWSC